MWPFKKKQIEYKVVPETKPSLFDELEKKFKPGKKFYYLGIECLCTSTREMRIIKTPWNGYEPYLEPVVTADYVDNNGVIRQIKLDFDEAMRL